jgi:hypothetical protein
LQRYNNPIGLAAEMMPEDADLNAFMNEKLRAEKWITIWQIEQILIERRQGYCNYVLYRVRKV